MKRIYILIIAVSLLGMAAFKSTAQSKINCSQAMNEASFNQLLSAIKGETFAQNKMDVAQQGTRCLSTAQVKTILGLFVFENQKLEFAKFAYPRTVDKDNYYTINSSFTYSSSKSEMNDFLKNQSPGQETIVTDPGTVVPPTPRKTEVQMQSLDEADDIPTKGIMEDDKQENFTQKQYEDALSKYKNFFEMVLGNDNHTIGEDGSKPHKADEHLESKAPKIVITSPELNEENNFTFRTPEKKVKVSGVISSTVGVYEVMVNENEAVLNPSGEFWADLMLAPGENKVLIKVTDLKKKVARISFAVVREQKNQPNPKTEEETVVVPKKEEPPVNPQPKTEPKTEPKTDTKVIVSDVDKGLPKSGMKNKDGIAVVIGNMAYTKTKPVDYAVNDARSMKNYLTNVLGFSEGNILYYENATFGDFNTLFGVKGNAKGKLFNTIKQNVSEVFIFYAGHGAPGLKDNKGYFVPVEADPNYIEIGGYCLETLYENLGKLPVKSVTMITDACFSGANVFDKISPIVIKAKMPAKTPIKNAVFISSSSGTEVSCWYPEQAHGMFTYFFLKALQKPAEADLDKDKKLTYEEVYKFVSDNNEGVPYYARRIHGITQTPKIQGTDAKRVILKY